jgi:hypothetical protein
MFGKIFGVVCSAVLVVVIISSFVVAATMLIAHVIFGVPT